MLRAGVVGVGTMGALHARVYASLTSDCELTGMFDPNHVRAQEIAERWGTRVFPSMDDLLDAVDVVSIASPTRFHFAHASRALAAGCDILIEKPVTLTVLEARDLQSLAAQAPHSPIVQVGHIEHFNPAICELRKVLQTESIVAVNIQRLGPFDERVADMDVIQDLMLHDIHVLLSIANSPLQSVQAVGRAAADDHQVDYVVANFTFDDGLIATLSASRVTEDKIRQIGVSTRDAYIALDYLQRTIEISRSTRLLGEAGGGRTYRQESVRERVWVPIQEPLVAEVQSFLHSVRTRRHPEVGLEAGVRCLEVVDMVRQAMVVPVTLSSTPAVARLSLAA